MTSAPTRFPRIAALRMTVRVAVAVLGFSIATAAAAADPRATEIVIKVRDSALPKSSATLPAAVRSEASRALRVQLRDVEQTINGAYRLALEPPLPAAAALAAVNRLRNDPDVLYVNITRFDGGMADTTPTTPKATGPEPLLHRIVVKYREVALDTAARQGQPLVASRLTRIATAAGLPVANERTIAWAGAYVVRLFTQQTREQAEAIAAAIASDPEVLWAQPDYRRQANVVPNDTQYPNQWHYYEAAGGANLPTAWDRTTGWSGVRVAVIDTGALYGHPDLGAKFIGGYDFILDTVVANDGDPALPAGCNTNPLGAGCNSRDANPADPGDWVTSGEAASGWLQGCTVENSSWHGTHVGGTVGAITNNASGVSGVNWNARIVPFRVLGKCGGYDTDIADSMEYASGGTVSGVPANAYPVRVMNLSLGGGGGCPALYQTAIDNSLARGTVVVVSAGNSNIDAVNSTPANCMGVITTAATSRAGQRASYSNFGTLVEIAAPGGGDGQGVLSTLNSGTTTPDPTGFNYVLYAGTSMAAPHVAGLASLILSIKPSATPGQVLSTIQSTARAFPTGTGRDCTSNPGSVTSVIKFCGAGIIDASAALTSIAAGLTTTTTALVSDVNPATTGAPVTLTATVTGSTPPTGTVGFSDSGTTIAGCGTVALVGSGNSKTAQCVTSGLGVGTHPLLAAYSGTSSQIPSDSSILSQVITPGGGPQPTTTTLASSANPAPVGASVTFTATVVGTNIPTGPVGFTANAATIAGCSAVALVGTGTTKTAQCATSALPAGANAIVANFAGDANNLASSGNLTQNITSATACSGFNDVLSTSPFCPNVDWIKNRLITLGCTSSSLYCPNDAVTRLAMAAFLNREGTALTPAFLTGVSDLPTSTNVTGVGGVVACQTADYPVVGFPRTAVLDAAVNVYSPNAAIDVQGMLAVSTDGGGTWTTVGNTDKYMTLYPGAAPANDLTIPVGGVVALNVGTTYRFGIRVQRFAGTGTSIGIYCRQQAKIISRDGTSSPFDLQEGAEATRAH